MKKTLSHVTFMILTEFFKKVLWTGPFINSKIKKILLLHCIELCKKKNASFSSRLHCIALEKVEISASQTITLSSTHPKINLKQL